VSSSTSIISNQSRTTTSSNSLLFSSSHEPNNDERIQLIVDDINHIVEKYTQELDDTISKKSITMPIDQQKIIPLPKRQIGNYHLLIEYIRKSNCVKD